MGRFSLASVWTWAFRGDYESQRTRVLCVLFFFSGFPALIYQLTWQRTLFRVFGVNIESVTIASHIFEFAELGRRALPMANQHGFAVGIHVER
jgi:hypothetical protein